ncbi:MAG: hypothetical protein SGBAC_007607 [Bacillariaceae sp.]
MSAQHHTPYFATDSPQLMAKSPTKRKRSRREIPDDATNLYFERGYCPTTHDVITKGGHYQNTYERNQQFWRRVLSERTGYLKLSKYEHEARNAIVESIYDYVLSTGGRFLRLDAKSGQWLQLPKKTAMHEVEQALNERYVPYFARPQSSCPKASSRPDTSAFEAFLKQAPSAAPKTSSSNFFSNFSQSSLQPSGSIDFMACINNKSSNVALLQQVPESMNAYLEDQMNAAFSSSNSSLVEAM